MLPIMIILARTAAMILIAVAAFLALALALDVDLATSTGGRCAGSFLTGCYFAVI